MTIDALYNKYQEDFSRSCKEWETFSNSPEYKNGLKGYKDYSGFKLDYNWFSNELVAALQEDFGLTLEQAKYIHGKAYDQFHSGFSDIFYGAAELARFCMGFPASLTTV